MARAVRSRRVVVSLLTGALVVLGAGGVTLASAAPALPAGLAAAANPYLPPTLSAGDITLDVVSARSVNEAVPELVKKGDKVPTYKWMINADDTGNPGTVSNQLLDKCLPKTAPGGS